MLKSILIGLGIFLILNFIYMLRSRKTVLSREHIGQNFVLSAFFMAILPGFMVSGSVQELTNSMKDKDFCGQCHIMDYYVKSLHTDDDEVLAAVHYQNNYVPKDQACYTCHTSYSAFGGVKAKMNGLMHVAVNYFGTHPDTIKLYRPYNNNDCLHCHRGSKRFENESDHTDEDDFLIRVESGELSCLECHDVAHYVYEDEE